MKILLITEFFPSLKDIDVHGGVEARAFYVGRELARKHKVCVIATYEYDKPRYQKLFAMEISRVGIKRSYTRGGHLFIRFIFIIQSILEGLRIDFDIVEGSGLLGWIPTIVLGFLKRKKNILLIADTFDSYGKSTGLILFKLVILMEKLILKMPFTHAIVISEVVKNKIILLGVNPKKITVIYCGIPAEQIKSIARKKNKLPTIVTISRLVPYKRVIDVVEALMYVQEHIPTIQLKIIGSGEELESLKQRVHELNLEKKIIFYGFLPSYSKLLTILKRADVFCLPSLVEGFGIATVEALACGVPVITADLPIHHEITQNKGALFFKPKDSIDLANKIIDLLKQKKLYKKLQQETKFVLATYDWNKQINKTEDLYARLHAH